VVGGDPERLSAVGDRLELLRALARKHGGSLEAALSRRDAMREELARLSGGGDRLAELGAEIEQKGAEALRLADELSRLRAGAARRLSEAVERELAGLAMGRCRIEVALLPPEVGVEMGGRQLSPGGAERAEILIAPNPGEPARPLARIASGGELSRLLLAVKRILARRDPVSTYVFDEVDSGIGGAVAETMGRVLADVSGGRQVLCITHLPQVAAFADRHHLVEKAVSGGRTHTAVTELEGEAARRREVARMMAGLTVTPTALDHAAALMAAARLPPAQTSAVGLRLRGAARRYAQAERTRSSGDDAPA
jgi:DNA repair protein RecN (Recombination protein N)